jgi:hypothetical protein
MCTDVLSCGISRRFVVHEGVDAAMVSGPQYTAELICQEVASCLPDQNLEQRPVQASEFLPCQ